MVEVSESHRGGRRGWVAAHACLKVCAGGAGGRGSSPLIGWRTPCAQGSLLAGSPNMLALPPYLPPGFVRPLPFETEELKIQKGKSTDNVY